MAKVTKYCPKCQKETGVWDNRQTKKFPNQPDWCCADCKNSWNEDQNGMPIEKKKPFFNGNSGAKERTPHEQKMIVSQSVLSSMVTVYVELSKSLKGDELKQAAIDASYTLVNIAIDRAGDIFKYTKEEK